MINLRELKNMITRFSFTTEDNEDGQVEFSVTRNENKEQCYGIKAMLFINGKISETETVDNIYFTLCETERVIEMLCRHQALPGTLCDIL